jgi:hypothetical protein
MNKFGWLKKDEVKRPGKYWHNAVGEDSRMFYDEADTHFEVGDLPNGDTDGVKGVRRD